MSRAAFVVAGRFVLASKTTTATVTVDRETGVVAVRPKRSRRVFVLPLANIAEWIVREELLRDAQKAHALRLQQRRGRR